MTDQAGNSYTLTYDRAGRPTGLIDNVNDTL
ncbi:MAG TPA: hypothetical protein DCK76_04435 [Desulfotomaculum sp.]|nr:hypothetical protein [Desulfotomaculum sp.]HBY03526.1 hypothetical protein [Desulfotomaculum sp.]